MAKTPGEKITEQERMLNVWLDVLGLEEITDEARLCALPSTVGQTRYQVEIRSAVNRGLVRQVRGIVEIVDKYELSIALDTVKEILVLEPRRSVTA